MTNQQGAPEALTVVAPTKAQIIEGLRAVQSGIGPRRPAIYDQPDRNRWGYIDAACAALVEAQQPAPSAAAAATEGHGRTDAEIVAQTVELTEYLLSWKWGLEPEGDTSRIWESKNTKALVCWNAACHIQDLLTQTDVWNAVAELDGQPSPTPQADSAPTSGNWVSGDDVNRLVRELDVALNGKAGAAAQASLCDVVAQVRLEAAKRGQPLLAPQADSQPAPVLDSLALMKVVMRADEALAGRCTRGTTNWAAAIGKAVQDAVLAARATADSVTAPAGGVVAGPSDLDGILDALSRHDDPCEDTADALRRVRTLVKEVARLTRAENAWIDRMAHIDSTATGEEK